MAKNLLWAFYGGFIRNPPLPSNARSLLFICKGNICRSPFAEYMAKSIIAKESSISRPCEVFSAGIHVEEPKKPPSEAIASAKRFGIELQGHKSRPINYDLLESYDMIVAMETWQYKYLRKLFLEFENKIYLLPLFFFESNPYLDGYRKYNIQDPYGRNIEEFNECFGKIEKYISMLFSKIGIINKISRERT
jgi:protein-tyrosine-phosphatase